MKKYLKLKKVNITDLIQIRFWRNDHVTRNNSFNKNHINSDEHAKWFFKTLFNNKKKLFMGIDENNNKIGITRLDKINKELVEVSININPNFRNSGFGKSLLFETVKKVFREKKSIKILSRILKTNEKSIKLFQKVGFKLSTIKPKSYEYILNSKNFAQIIRDESL
jgi:RimJ/RimL family protein N-acetyltransferase